MPIREFPASGQDMDEGGDGGDLRMLVDTLRRRLRLIISVFAVAATLIVAYTLLQPKLYTATATIMINPRQERVLSADQAMTDSDPTSAVVDSEIEVLRSPQLAERLVRSLNLADDPNWNASLRPKNPLVEAVGAIESLFASASASRGEEAAVVDAVGDAIKVRRRALSYVIDVSVTARTPQEAARLSNALVDAYLAFGYEARMTSTQRASGWLTQRLNELRADVQQKEAAAQSYRAQSGLLTSAGVSLTEQQIGEVQGAVLTARADLAEKEAQYQQVQTLVNSGQSAESIAAALSSETIRDLRQRESDLTRHQAELENTLGERHPDVLSGRAEIANVHAQIAAEIARIQTGLRNEVQVARTRLQTLEGSLGSVRGNLITNNSAAVRLNELEREAAAARSVYESFLQRYHEVTDQGGLDSTDVRIVANARAPDAPSSPNLLLAAALALVVGAGAGVGLALLMETLDEGLKSAEETERKLGLATIASIPAVPHKTLRLLEPGDRHPAGYVAARPMSAFAESFRVLKTAITYSMLDKKAKIVAFTSALPNEGKTTCALSFARIAAAAGQRTLLIDCDLRRHSLNLLLAIEPRAGLLQVLAGEADWRDLVGQDEQSGAHVLPVAGSKFTPQDVFESDAMARLIEEVSEAYDCIVLDCPPVLAVADSRVIASHADGVVVVARWEKTPARAVGDALTELRKTRARILGIALNCVDARSPGRSSYGHSLYYYDSAKGYYAQ